MLLSVGSPLTNLNYSFELLLKHAHGPCAGSACQRLFCNKFSVRCMWLHNKKSQVVSFRYEASPGPKPRRFHYSNTTHKLFSPHLISATAIPAIKMRTNHLIYYSLLTLSQPALAFLDSSVAVQRDGTSVRQGKLRKDNDELGFLTDLFHQRYYRLGSGVRESR